MLPKFLLNMQIRRFPVNVTADAHLNVELI
jgi:hypothetical protein